MQSHPSTPRPVRICSRPFTPYITTLSGGSYSWGAGSRRLLTLLAAALPCASAFSADVTSTWRAAAPPPPYTGVTLWSASSNWSNSPSSGSYPKNGNGGVPTYDAVLSNGGVITLNEDVTIESFTFSGGNLTGNGALTLNNNLHWTRGELTGTGSITVSGNDSYIRGGNIPFGGGEFYKSLNRTLTNTGTMNFGGDLNLGPIPYYGTTGVINNIGTWNMRWYIDQRDTVRTSHIGGPGLINNSGTWNFFGLSTTDSVISAPFNNSGTVNINSGRLRLFYGNDAPYTGAFNVANGSVFRFFHQGNAGGTFSAASSISGAGKVEIGARNSGKSIDINGTYNVTGVTLFSGASVVNFNGPIVSLGSTTIAGGTVNFNSTVPTLSGLTLSGGTFWEGDIPGQTETIAQYGGLGGSAPINIAGNLVWAGPSQMIGTGTTTVSGDASTISGAGNKTLDRTLNNTGTLTLTAPGTAASGMNMPSAAAIINNSGTWSNVGNAGFSGDGTINNTGIWNVSGPGTTNTVIVTFNNFGTVNVQSGALEFYRGSNEPTTGAFNIASGAKFTLRPNTALTLDATSSISGAGSMEFGAFSRGSVVNINGVYNVTGSTTFSGDGTVNFNAPITSLGTTTFNGGNINFNSTVPALDSLTLAGGNLSGSSPITIGNLTWTGVHTGMTGTGTTTISGTASTISGAGVKILSRTLNNTGTVTFTSPSDTGTSINFETAADALNNSGTFYTVGGGDFGGNGTINNSGTWNVSGAGTTSIIGSVFKNSGTVNVQSGTLQLHAALPEDTTGAYNIASGATVRLAVSGIIPLTLGATSSISGTGIVDFANTGTVNINGTYNVTGATVFTGRGAVNFNSPITSLGSGPLTITGGTINFNSTTPTLSGLNLTAGTTPGLGAVNGTLSGASPINIEGDLAWTGVSAMAGTGTTIVSGNASTISGAGTKTLDRTLNNTGTMTYSATSDTGTTIAFGSAAGVLNNSGTFNVVGGADFGTGGTINNSGTWNVSGAGATTTIGSVFNNSGTVNVASGAIVYNGGYKQTGGSLAFNGSNFTTSTPINVESGTVSGTGTITGRLNNIGGTISPGNSPGALNIVGDLTLGNDSTLAMEIGGRTQGTEYDLLSEAGTIALTLDGLLSVRFLNGFQNSILSTDVFTILTSNQALTGAFDNVANGARINTADGLGSFLVSYGAGSPFGADKVVLSQFAIPEPSSAMLLASAGGLLLMRRRRASRR